MVSLSLEQEPTGGGDYGYGEGIIAVGIFKQPEYWFGDGAWARQANVRYLFEVLRLQLIVLGVGDGGIGLIPYPGNEDKYGHLPVLNYSDNRVQQLLAEPLATDADIYLEYPAEKHPDVAVFLKGVSSVLAQTKPFITKDRLGPRQKRKYKAAQLAGTPGMFTEDRNRFTKRAG